jgi:hypothetical protein
MRGLGTDQDHIGEAWKVEKGFETNRAFFILKCPSMGTKLKADPIAMGGPDKHCANTFMVMPLDF